MTALHQKLEGWVISETHLLSDRHMKLFPETSDFCRLVEGKHKKIWKYVIDNVRSRSTANKVRRILRVKQDQDLPENPYPVKDADHILKRIAKAEEKRSYLNGSLSELKRETAATEDDLKSIVDKVSILNQKSAISELIIAEYNKKCTFLNSIHSQLTTYVVRNSKQNTNLALNYKSNLGADQVFNKVKYLLKHVQSIIMVSNGTGSLTDNLVQRLNQVLDAVSLADLFILLKEISKASYIELMSNETESPSARSSDIKTETSAKYLQGMKLKFIQSSFAVKKAKQETHRLQDERESLVRKMTSKNGGDAFQKKCEIFEKMGENEGLGESIKFLEDALKNEQSETKILKDNDKNANPGNLEVAIKNFYSNFDTLCMLLKSSSHMRDSIFKLVQKLHTFANKQMFCNLSQISKEYPLHMKEDLMNDIQTLWSVLEKNILYPLMPSGLSLESWMSGNLMTMLDVSRFENECVIGCKVRETKNELSSHRKSNEFKFAEDDVNVDEHSRAMMETLQKMQSQLELCIRNFRETTEYNQRVQIVLRDWWEQGAQFIPHIEWEDKSLKMWLDILLVLSDI